MKSVVLGCLTDCFFSKDDKTSSEITSYMAAKHITEAIRNSHRVNWAFNTFKVFRLTVNRYEETG